LLPFSVGADEIGGTNAVEFLILLSCGVFAVVGGVRLLGSNMRARLDCEAGHVAQLAAGGPCGSGGALPDMELPQEPDYSAVSELDRDGLSADSTVSTDRPGVMEKVSRKLARARDHVASAFGEGGFVPELAQDMFFVEPVKVRLVDSETGAACPSGWPDAEGGCNCVMEFGDPEDSYLERSLHLAYSICHLTGGCASPSAWKAGAVAMVIAALRSVESPAH